MEFCFGKPSPTRLAASVTGKTIVVVHPTYTDALNLQNVIVSSLDENVDLKQSGLIGELPGAVSIADYQQALSELRDNLKSLPFGPKHASEFEDLMGEVLRLCFFRALTNVEPKVRSVDNRIIRDWVAANHSEEGFWALVRQKYGAVQIIWECKNYGDLAAEDFQQAAYYMSEAGGRFVL